MKRFGLVMDDSLYYEFYRLFPDHGMRTSVLRRCVHRMVQKAKAVGMVPGGMADEIADMVQQEIRED